MTDLKDRFEELDRLPMPADLWSRIGRLAIEPATPRPRVRRLLPVVAGFLAVIAVGGITYFAFGGRLDRGVSVPPSTIGSQEATSTTRVDQPVLVDVPDMRGMTAQEAAAALRTAGLTVTVAGEEPLPEDPADLDGPLAGLRPDQLPGLIARQTPEAGEMAERGSVVEIFVFGISPGGPAALCPAPRDLPAGAPQWMVELHGLAAALAEDTNRLSEALDATGDLSAGWQTRPPIDSVLGAVEADLQGIVDLAEGLGWVEIEAGYWEPPGDYPAPDDPLNWLEEMLGGVSRYQAEILPEWYALTGREAVVGYLTTGGQHGTPCGGAAGVVMVVDHMIGVAG